MDGNRKKPDGRLQFQKERFFSRFCALQVLFQQDFQPEIEWDAQRWSYYLCMISDVLDEQEEYLPYSLEKHFQCTPPGKKAFPLILQPAIRLLLIPVHKSCRSPS